MSSDTDYDVIIIGSGAGGGTLAGHLAPSGKRILILERGDWLPREIENWDADEVFVKNRYVPEGHLVRRPAARRSSRASTTTSGARRSSTAPRCTGSGRKTSASCATTTGSRPRGRSRTTTSSRTTRRPSSSTRCTATTARTRPSPAPAAPYPFPARDPRAAHPAAVRRPGAGRLSPVPRAVRHPAARGRPAEQPLHPLRDLRRLPVARPGQVRRRDLRRPAGARAPQRDAPDERPGDAADDRRRRARR